MVAKDDEESSEESDDEEEIPKTPNNQVFTLILYTSCNYRFIYFYFIFLVQTSAFCQSS